MQRVPAELKALNQWCLWDDRNGTKVPVQPDGQPFKSNDPSTWHSFERCDGAAAFHTGFGFALDAPYTGIDLDNCLDADGKLRDWAVPILRRFDELAYAEVSPSGRGIKLLTRARKTHGAICTHKIAGDKQQVESWDHGRYFAITGNVYNDQTTIGDGQAAVDWLCETYLKPTVPQQVATAKLPPAEPRYFDGNSLLTRAVGYVDNVPGTVKGGLRNAAFSLSGHLHSLVDEFGNRLTDTEVLDLLARWNVRNSPPLRDDELLEASVNGRTNGTPRADKPPNVVMVLPDDGFDPTRLMKSEETKPPTEVREAIKELPRSKTFDEPFPPECLNPGGTLQRIIDYNLETAMYPMPSLALAGALALLSVITGRKVQDRRELRTNGYYLGLAAAGSGKNFARQLNAKILIQSGADSMLGASKLKSSGGLVNALVESPACLFQLDEISRLLHTMRNPRDAPHLYDIGSVMLEAYGEANTLWKPGAYVDTKKNPVIPYPHLVIYGTAVPEDFWSSITIGNLTDGLLGRMMVFEHEGDPPLTDNDLRPLPAELLNDVRAWLEFSPGKGNLRKEFPQAVTVQHTAEAWNRYWTHAKAIVAGKPGESIVAKGIWRRTAEKTGKLSILSACSRTPPMGNVLPVVELCDVEFGIKLAKWLTKRILSQAGLYVAENQHHDNLNRILRMLTDWTSKAEVGAKCRWMKARDRDDLIRSAILDGLIEQRNVDTGGTVQQTQWRRTDIGNGI